MNTVSDHELEKFYEAEILPKFAVDVTSLKWIDHAQIDLDTFAHYFRVGEYEYALRFDDYYGPHTFLDDEGKRVPLVADEKAYMYSNPAPGQYIVNKTGDFMLYQLRHVA